MDDKKELAKEKCSIKGCKDKSTGVFKRKPYCQIHYNKINPRAKENRYAVGPVYS